MGKEKFSLSRHSSLDVLPAVDILLRPVHHTDVSTPEKKKILVKYFDNVTRTEGCNSTHEGGDRVPSFPHIIN